MSLGLRHVQIIFGLTLSSSVGSKGNGRWLLIYLGDGRLLMRSTEFPSRSFPRVSSYWIKTVDILKTPNYKLIPKKSLKSYLLNKGGPNLLNCVPGSIKIQIISKKPDHFLAPSGSSPWKRNQPDIVFSHWCIDDLLGVIDVNWGQQTFSRVEFKQRSFDPKCSVHNFRIFGRDFPHCVTHDVATAAAGLGLSGEDWGKRFRTKAFAIIPTLHLNYFY